MPRKARIDIPGLLQHVIVRGIERRKIFLDDNDRLMFVNRFSALLEDTDTDCFAWALLDNHVHVLLRCNRTELSRFMKRLLTGYAVNFNHRHRRSGHLFQNRYKSIICEEDVYLLELIRYIHLNPLRAGIVPDLESLGDYPWCGHAILMGTKKFPGQVVEEVLQLFGTRLISARQEYRQFVSDGIPQGRRPELVGGGLRRSQMACGIPEEIESYDDRVLGSGQFVESLQQETKISDILPIRLTLSELTKIVCKLLEVSPELILRRTRRGDASQARAVFCYVAVRMCGMVGVDVGKLLSMGPSSVSRAAHRGEHILLERPTLKKKLDSVLIKE
jgi:REP element-mobilizing transposase RayT